MLAPGERQLTSVLAAERPEHRDSHHPQEEQHPAPGRSAAPLTVLLERQHLVSILAPEATSSAFPPEPPTIWGRACGTRYKESNTEEVLQELRP